MRHVWTDFSERMWMITLVETYIDLLAEKSETKSHELIKECLDYYNVNGVFELTEEQVINFCKMKGLVV